MVNYVNGNCICNGLYIYIYIYIYIYEYTLYLNLKYILHIKLIMNIHEYNTLL